jgi:hypothetical protein
MTKTLFRRGDTVTFTGTVRYPGEHDGKIFVTYGVGDTDYCLVPADKLTLDRAKVEVGDRIQSLTGAATVDVLMVGESGDLVVSDTHNKRLHIIQPEAVYQWRRVPPVDEIAEIAASMGETKRLEEERE